MSEAIKDYLAALGIDSLEIQFTSPDEEVASLWGPESPMPGGVKFDAGKLRYDLLPPDVLEALAQILTDGAKKYGDRNWEKAMAWSRPYAALMRHLLAWWGGQQVDEESGRSHLWHVLTNAAFLVAYEQRGIGEDDRP